MTTELETIPEAGNGRAMAPRQTAAAQTAVAREAQEVQAAMIVAQKFPRDEIEAERRIMQACKRKGLAEQAMYAYPRGGETVTGPSIRLAEVLAQNWGNIYTAVKELSQEGNSSEMLACAWDLQTNYRNDKIFSVKHERHTKSGVKKLTDPRDIYEVGANQGARRLRACILAVIPGDIVDAAVAECEKTMAGNNSEPLVDRVKKMLAKFEELGVSKAMIEKRLNHKTDSIIAAELVQLAKIFKSLTDGFAKKEEFFGGEEKKAGAEPSELEKTILGEKTDPKKAEEPAKDLSEPVAADRVAMETQDAIDGASNVKESQEVRSKLDANKQLLGEARYNAFVAMWQAAHKDLEAKEKKGQK